MSGVSLPCVSPSTQPHRREHNMDSHTAKQRALQKKCAVLRFALQGDFENMKFELCAAGLIPAEVRNQKEASPVVSAIENQLAVNEAVWDKLLDVLNRCNARALVEQLNQQLREEMASRRI